MELLYTKKTKPTALKLIERIALLREYANGQGPAIIRWGSSQNVSAEEGARVLNTKDAVKTAVSKIATFKAIDEKVDKSVAITPLYTETVEAAVTNTQHVIRHAPDLWDKKHIFCRMDNQFGGRGITVLDTSDPGAQVVADVFDFYSFAVPTYAEYRVHVFNGAPIYIQKKLPMEQDQREELGISEQSDLIRSREHGWRLSTREIARVAEDIKAGACAAVAAVELDFGAVDVIVTAPINDPKRKIVILEVNSAPALDNSTLDAYVTAITSWYETEVAVQTVTENEYRVTTMPQVDESDNHFDCVENLELDSFSLDNESLRTIQVDIELVAQNDYWAQDYKEGYGDGLKRALELMRLPR